MKPSSFIRCPKCGEGVGRQRSIAWCTCGYVYATNIGVYVEKEEDQ